MKHNIQILGKLFFVALFSLSLMVEAYPQQSGNKKLVGYDIISVEKAGLSEENILATLTEAPAVSFDLSSNAQMQLIQAGVTNRMISAMRQAKKSK
jgi:hypothetical protein